MTSLLEQPNNLLERSNSVVDKIYELQKESSSSIYPDLEKNVRINLPHIYLDGLLKSLLSHSIQNSNTINLNTKLNAINWIIELRKIIGLRKYWWCEPLVNISDSDIIFEWWHQQKKVTVYFSETDAEFIKVWGADIDIEMEEGFANTNEQIESLWKWLVS